MIDLEMERIMRNLVIILLIIVLPIIAYITLDSHKHKNMISLAQAGNKPVVMVFSSAMCSECQNLKKVLVVVEPKYKDKIEFVKYDAASSDPNVQSLIKKYNVYLVPTMVFVDKSGNKKDRTEGSMSQAELEKKLKALL